MGDLVHFPKRGRRPPRWPPNRRRRGLSASDVRMMVWIGLILGLLAFQALRLWPQPDMPPVLVELPQPWAESRRSREILEEQEAPPARAAAEQQYVRAAVRVIDGDTFDYGGFRVRIADIDTPELRGRCAHEIALARRATQRIETLLATGPFELLPLPGGRDEDCYGRKLRIVTRNGRSLGDALVAEGLARTWTGRREPCAEGGKRRLQPLGGLPCDRQRDSWRCRPSGKGCSTSPGGSPTGSISRASTRAC